MAEEIRITDGAPYLPEIKELIVEYTGALGRDLTFQNLSQELEHLEHKYVRPNGQILAAVTETGQVVGCVAFHRHTNERCEMKRLYVKKESRHLHTGSRLVGELIRLARKEGYGEMVLDTLRPMENAIRLYRKFGFQEIPAYYHNPMEDVVYMGLDLRSGTAVSSGEHLKEVTVGAPVEINGPIFLAEPDPSWPAQFLKEKEKIHAALGAKALRVEHVGSTSVPGLCAKPILDILLLVDDPAAEAEYVPALENGGYRLRIREPEWYEHRMLKGYDPEVNLHVFAAGCGEAERMLDFRDWLREHEEDRDRYAAAKRELSRRTWKYVQDYADAKTKVVREIGERAISSRQGK